MPTAKAAILRIQVFIICFYVSFSHLHLPALCKFKLDKCKSCNNEEKYRRFRTAKTMV